jgi:hypothetical protein
MRFYMVGNNYLSDQMSEMRFSDPVGYAAILLKAKEIGPDLIIIDTLAPAFVGVNEMNADEVATCIAKPLNDLCIETGASTLMSHHIGKEKSEEGRTHLDVYRSRGSSNIAGEHRLIIQLESRINNGVEERILSFPKTKRTTEEMPDHAAEFNPNTFWVSLKEVEDANPFNEKNYKVLIDTLKAKGNVKKSELKAALNGLFASDRTLDRYLDRALKLGDARKPVYGYYAPVT